MVDADFIGSGLCGGLPLDARPGQVHVKEEQQNAEAEDGGLLGKSARVSSGDRLELYIELIVLPHQGVVEQMAVDLRAG